MKAGYESMIWVRDNDGREFACYMDDVKDEHNLTEEERAKCLDVNQIVGTERW